MIIDVWKPRYKSIDGVKTITHLEQIDKKEFLENKKSGWVVRYFCDTCNSINTTTSHVFLNNKSNLNTLNKQMCRSCRTRFSEYEIKKTQINYKVIYKSITDEGYNILLKENTYNNSDNKSQLHIPVICNNNHNYNTTWNNWSRGKRCRVCYEKNKYEKSVKYKYGWELYKFLVWHHTENNYKKFFTEINPKNFKRGDNYHLDHKFSMSEGFNLGILPSIIGSVKNLEIISSKENMSKGSKCSITLEEIFDMI